MFFEYLSLLLGIVKVFFYKLFYFKRLKFNGVMKCNSSIHIITKAKSQIMIGNGFRSRNNVSLRIYNGTLNIDDDCFLNDNVSINCVKNIKIGKKFKAGQNVIIIDHDHDYNNDIEKFCSDDIVIGNNVWIGANSIILKGTHIGDNCVIAAGSIVSDTLEKNTIFIQKKDSSLRRIK